MMQQGLLQGQEERPAAQVRVTAEELAQAVAAVESRDTAVAMQHAETISLGDAVNQLGLHTTPEELLAEIQVRRAKLPVDPRLERKQRRRRLLVRTGIALSLAANMFLLFCVVVLNNAVVARQGMASRLARQSYTTESPNSSAGEIRLSSLDDRETAYVDLYTLYGLAHGKSLAQEEGYPNQSVSQLRGPQWEIIKLDGKLYVKAWAIRREDGAFDEVSSVQTATSPEQAPVTVPIERFRVARDPSSLKSPVFNSDVDTSMRVEVVKLAPERAGK
jgi:hypothetical protein